MKTLKIMQQYMALLREQGPGAEMPPDPSMAPGGEGEIPPDITEPAEEPPEELPLTSEGELEYVINILDAVFFDPNSLSVEDKSKLLDYQSLLKVEKDINVRPIKDEILSIINPNQGIEQPLASAD